MNLYHVTLRHVDDPALEGPLAEWLVQAETQKAAEQLMASGGLPAELELCEDLFVAYKPVTFTGGVYALA